VKNFGIAEQRQLKLTEFVQQRSENCRNWRTSNTYPPHLFNRAASERFWNWRTKATQIAARNFGIGEQKEL
jgi:hypothetical protein